MSQAPTQARGHPVTETTLVFESYSTGARHHPPRALFTAALGDPVLGASREIDLQLRLGRQRCCNSGPPARWLSCPLPWLLHTFPILFKSLTPPASTPTLA